MWTRSDSVGQLIEDIKLSAYEKPIWKRRVGHQVGFGDAALQEASKNLDFPPAALFFLQTAHSYYAMALADCMGQSTMALLTRPMTRLRRMALETGCELDLLVKGSLHLEGEPTASLRSLERVYGEVSARCSRPFSTGIARLSS